MRDSRDYHQSPKQFYDRGYQVSIDEIVIGHQIIILIKLFDAGKTTVHRFIVNERTDTFDKIKKGIKTHSVNIRSACIDISLPANERFEKLKQEYEMLLAYSKALYDILDNSTGSIQFSKLYDKLSSNETEDRGLILNSEHFVIPFEFLSDKKSYNVATIDSLFLGSSYCIVKESIGNERRGIFPEIRINMDFLRFLVFSDTSYKGIRTIEKPYFEKLPETYHGHKILVFEPLEKLITQHDVRQILDNHEHEILHLAGHLDQQDVISSKLTVDNATTYLKHFTVSQSIKNSIVFLNICNSGDNNIGYFTNPYKMFLDQGVACIICVDLDVPDGFAAQFTTKVYDKFLQLTRLDKAVHESVVECLKEGDITGMFYSVYGQANVQLMFDENK